MRRRVMRPHAGHGSVSAQLLSAELGGYRTQSGCSLGNVRMVDPSAAHRKPLHLHVVNGTDVDAILAADGCRRKRRRSRRRHSWSALR